MALKVSQPLISFWVLVNPHDAPPFSGGLLDSWPAWAVDAIAICKQEDLAISAYLQYERNVAS